MTKITITFCSLLCNYVHVLYYYLNNNNILFLLLLLATLGDACKSAGVAAYTRECRKHSSNDPKCQELGWVCIPLAVEHTAMG